jgi:hypothetical protein
MCGLNCVTNDELCLRTTNPIYDLEPRDPALMPWPTSCSMLRRLSAGARWTACGRAWSGPGRCSMKATTARSPTSPRRPPCPDRLSQSRGRVPETASSADLYMCTDMLCGARRGDVGGDDRLVGQTDELAKWAHPGLLGVVIRYAAIGEVWSYPGDVRRDMVSDGDVGCQAEHDVERVTV